MNQKKFEFILSKSVSHQSKAVLLGCTLLVLAGSLHPVLANLSDPFFQAVLVISGSPSALDQHRLNYCPFDWDTGGRHAL